MPDCRPFIAKALLVGLISFGAGCTQFPELDALPADPNTALPRLVPIEDIRAAVGTPRSTVETSNALASRATRLKSRAALMRGPILDPGTRARLAAAIAAGQA